MNKPIGAFADILFNDGGSVSGYYISFSDPASFDETTGDYSNDAYGVRDDQIFYYAPDGEAELKALSQDNPNNDFKILSYQLDYKE